MAVDIDRYGIIGNMRTAALVSDNGSIDSLCLPNFDSPSVFCRLLDDNKGGHFAIFPESEPTSVKQHYLPFSNVLSTKHITPDSVFQLSDFFPRTNDKESVFHTYLVRRAECIRNHVTLNLECFPAFNYARARHTTEIQDCIDNPGQAMVQFKSEDGLELHLCFAADFGSREPDKKAMEFKIEQRDGMLGPGVVAIIDLHEGENISFILKQMPTSRDIKLPALTSNYAFLRMGFTEEAREFMNFIERRLDHRNSDGSINIMYSIHGDSEIDEIELNHLSGYKGSRPVRIGNGAAKHLQLDIYGELMDAIYLYNKYGRPVSWVMWTKVREVCEYVVANWQQPDMSIWEVRSEKRQFTYSKIMMWVCLDRGIRLSEKRCLPCLNRDVWLKTRDTIYESVMTKCWNDKIQVNAHIGECLYQCFTQSYESPDVLDASVLIMPLVFFISPCDPRFLSTVNQILKSPDKGGLTMNNMVYRYDLATAKDGITGEEGAFTMCTMWLVEAMTRAGHYEQKAMIIFEDVIGYSNHVGLFSEEIAKSGENLGNMPQAFSHLSLISCGYNLDKALHKKTEFANRDQFRTL